MISVVVPFFNEQESLEIFYEELIKTLLQFNEPYEIIFIDDGSTDRTFEIAKKLVQQNKHIKLFSFRKNQGKAEALTLGFRKAKGEYIVTLDGDLQDKPSEMKKLLVKAKDGWDMVCGWRENRQDSWYKIVSSKIFNWLMKLLWGLKLHDYNCGLKVYVKDAAKNLSLYGGLHRFIPLIVYQQGFHVSEISVQHEKRKFGKSKYGFSKLWKDLPDIFTMLFLTRYSSRPFHFFGMVGAVLLLSGVGVLGYLSILHFQGHTIGRRPILFFGVLLVLSGFQVFFTGFLADLIAKLSHVSHEGSRKDNSDVLLKYASSEE